MFYYFDQFLQNIKFFNFETHKKLFSVVFFFNEIFIIWMLPIKINIWRVANIKEEFLLQSFGPLPEI